MKSVTLLKHLVDMVGHAVLALLHEFQLTDIRLQQGSEVGIGAFATLDVEPPLCIMKLTHQPVMMSEAFIVAPH